VRRRLLTVVVASSTLVVIAFAIPLGALVRSVARDRAVTAAERDAAAIAPVLALTDDPEFVTAAIDRTDLGADDRLTVWLADGTQLGDPTPADGTAMDLVRTDQASFTRSADDGLESYQPVITSDGQVSVVRARVPGSLLHRGVRTAWLALAGVGVALIAASALVADRLARTLTRDSQELATTARALASGDPEARAGRSTTPELDDAGRALNLLADRIDELRTAERERVADLSHRLRTPLTALRLDAERSGQPDLVADVDRVETAVTDLIESARRPLHAQPVRATCDAGQVAAGRAAFWSPLADDDGRRWQLEVPEAPTPVRCGSPELEAALDAVIGNVFAHTDAGTEYAVSVTRCGATAVITVDDAGPGISDAVLARRGVTGGSSTGLGLAIATDTAEAAGGRLTIDTAPLGGARVCIELPLAEAR
jgi:signal transduction histidine kinase